VTRELLRWGKARSWRDEWRIEGGTEAAEFEARAHVGPSGDPTTDSVAVVLIS
jgi:hypothetical protein